MVSSPSKTNAFQKRIEEIKVNEGWVKTQGIRANEKAFDEWVKEFAPSLVIYDRFIMEEQFSWRVRRVVENALHVLDTQDLHCVRKYRQMLVEKCEVDRFTSDVIKTEQEVAHVMIPSRNEGLCREIASILRSDVVLLVSSFEKQLLEERYGISPEKIVMAPFFYDLSKSKAEDFEKRSHFVSIGNYQHAPNADSILFLSRIWPKIRKALPNVQFHSFGAYDTPAMLSLSKPEIGFHVKGRLKEERLSKTFLKSRVLLSPLRFGAGIKGKIADAWLHGLPVSTTQIGAEGMDQLGFGGVVSSWAYEEKFIKNSVALYQDKDLWEKSRDIGAQTLFQYFSNSLAPDFVEKLLSVFEQRKKSFDLLQSVFLNESMQPYVQVSNYIEKKMRNKTGSL